jgi:hypothetical protein
MNSPALRLLRPRRLALAASLGAVLAVAAPSHRARAQGELVSSPAPAKSSDDAKPDVKHDAKPDEATDTFAIIGPVLTPVERTEKEPIKRVGASDPLAARAREVETALKEALQDLGLALDVAAQLPGDGVRELDLVQRAAQGNGAWVISPRLEQQGSDKFLLRIVAVPPKGATLLVRVEQVDGAHLASRAVVMLRDLVSMKLAPAPVAASESAPLARDEDAGRSRGRPVLAVSSSMLGLYGAFSIHRSSGSEDQRLLYPLLLLGTGVGLGASLLVADEWNVTTGSAWTVAAGSWWGVLAGLNLAAGRNVEPVADRHAWGLAGGLGGTALSVFALAATRYDEGDAALVHSSAIFGTFVGGLIEAIYEGDLGKKSPSTGFGWGSAVGLVGGGVLAGFVKTTPSRVFLIDLGCGIGALGGAAVTSALVVSDKTDAKTRGFLSGVLAGTVVGGGVAYFVTREPAKPAAAPAKAAYAPQVLPMGGVLGTSLRTDGSSVPIWGAGVMGAF